MEILKLICFASRMLLYGKGRLKVRRTWSSTVLHEIGSIDYIDISGRIAIGDHLPTCIMHVTGAQK